METTSLGKFKNQTTGETCEVIKVFGMRIQAVISGPNKDKVRNFRTSTGVIVVEVEKGDESRFRTTDNPPQILLRV